VTTENSSKVVLIEGKGRPLVDIVGEYISYITNGFDLTMSEIADYLGCSYSFVQKHIQSKVRHIKINQVARKGLLEFGLLEFEEGSEYRTLFNKRRLFDRKDFFERFIPEEATITKPAQRLFLEDLDTTARKNLMKKAYFNEVEAIKFFQVLVKKAPKRRPLNPVKPFEPLGRTPKELLSIKDITNLKFKYNIEAYRYIAKHAIPKIKVCSLVRYDREDVERKPAAILPVSVSKEAVLKWIEDQLM
jgi:hypothetical protein